MAADLDVEKRTICAAGEQAEQVSSDSELDLPTRDAELRPLDGGLVAWAQVAAGCIANMMAWGYPATFGVFQLYYRDTLGLPEAQISWIGSVQTFLAFFMC